MEYGAEPIVNLTQNLSISFIVHQWSKRPEVNDLPKNDDLSAYITVD